MSVHPMSVLEDTDDPLFVIRRDGRILFMNRAAGEYVDALFAGREISGCHMFCVRDGAGPECGEDCPITRAIGQRAVVRAERRFGAAADSAAGVEEFFVFPLAGAGDEADAVLLRICKVGEPVCDAGKPENRAAEQQELERLFFQVKRGRDEWINAMDTVADLVFLVDGSARVRRCNKAVSDLFGKPYQEILGRKWKELFLEADLHRKTGQVGVGQDELFHDASGRVFQETCYRAEIEESDAQRIITLHDVSERKRMQEIIEEHRKRLEGALDEISAMIQRVTQGNTEDVFFTLPPDHEPCWHMMQCVREECPCFGREPLQCWTVAGTRCRGTEQGAEQKHTTCMGCEFYQEATDDPVARIGIQFSHMMAIINNKNRELQQTYDELKATQSQFVQQEKMASIGQLAAGVAHEINNPIGFVTSNLGTLQKYLGRLTEFLEKQAELYPPEAGDDRALRLAGIRKQLKLDAVLEDLPALLAESLDGVERVRKIVQNLKSFSRVDQSDYSMADINQCLDDTLNIIWNELKYKCTVVKNYGELPLTRCYPQQLNQVFMNLLVNAAQAIEVQGEIVITTRASETEITIAIADSGSGIAPENLGRIFEPFFTTKEVGKGTGLGLSITYDIVTKKHGGRIGVESEPGKGTTFIVTLPVKTE